MTADELMEAYFVSRPPERAIRNYYGDEEDVPGRVYFLVTDGDRKRFPEELTEAKVVCLYCGTKCGLFCSVCE